MRILFRKELEEIPPLTWLLKDYIPEASFSMVWGRQESFKSFVALSLGCSVATGKPWLGMVPVGDPGCVVYICAEGLRGLRPRINAWEKANRIRANQLCVVRHPVTCEEVPEFAEEVNRLRLSPRLVILDTWSRCLGGDDENNSSTTEKFLHNLEVLRQQHDTSVLIVHHCDKAAQWPRGSYALQAAMDTIYEVHREEGSMICNVTCRKQKDAEHGPRLTLLARQVDESLVLERA